MGGQWLAVVTSVLAACAIIFGARLVLSAKVKEGAALHFGKLFALGTGVLVTAVMLDFLPDAWSIAGDQTPWGIFAGVLILWLMTRWVDDAFSNAAASTDDGTAQTPPGAIQFTVASAVILAVSLSAHGLLEGAALAVSAQHISVSSIVFMAAMLLHKVPEGVLWGLALTAAIPSTMTAHRTRLRFALMIPAACTLVGTLAGIVFVDVASSTAVAWLSAVLCGALMYICFCELLPMLRERSDIPWRNVWLFFGVFIMLIPISIGLIVGD